MHSPPQKNLKDLKTLILRIGNLWPLGFLASEICSFSVFKLSYLAVALLSFPASQLFRISVFQVSKCEIKK